MSDRQAQRASRHTLDLHAIVPAPSQPAESVLARLERAQTEFAVIERLPIGVLIQRQGTLVWAN